MWRNKTLSLTLMGCISLQPPPVPFLSHGPVLPVPGSISPPPPRRAPDPCLAKIFPETIVNGYVSISMTELCDCIDTAEKEKKNETTKPNIPC